MTDGTKLCPACGTLLQSPASGCVACGANFVAPTLRVDNDEALAVPTQLERRIDPELLSALDRMLAPSFVVVDLLATGAMGAILRGRDPLLKRPVAIKVLLPAAVDDATARERARREYQAAASVVHPNVVRIYQSGTLPTGAPFAVMELIEGQTLSHLVRSRGVLSNAAAKRAIGEAAAGLAAVHERSVVHRDVKGDNIMIESATGRAVVVDFGISLSIDANLVRTHPQLTVDGGIAGTPTHTSPEQIAGQHATAKSDVYGLGVAAFEAVTGELPFEALGTADVWAAHLLSAPPAVESFRTDLDRTLADIINRSLSKDPDLRPSAADIAKALAPATQIGIEWPPPGVERWSGAGASLTRVVGGAVAFGYTIWSLSQLLALGQVGCCDSPSTASPTNTATVVERKGVFGVSLDRRDAEGGLALLVLLGGCILLPTLAVLAVRTWRVLSLAFQSAALGYGWRTLIDVGWSLSDDSADLFNRRGPYSGQSTEARARMINGRRIRAICSVAAVVTAISGLTLMVSPFAVSSLGTSIPPVVGLTYASLLTLLLCIGLSTGVPEWRLRRSYVKGSLAAPKEGAALLSEKVAAAWRRTLPYPDERTWSPRRVGVASVVFAAAGLSALVLSLLLALSILETAWVRRLVDSDVSSGWLNLQSAFLEYDNVLVEVATQSLPTSRDGAYPVVPHSNLLGEQSAWPQLAAQNPWRFDSTSVTRSGFTAASTEQLVRAQNALQYAWDYYPRLSADSSLLDELIRSWPHGGYLFQLISRQTAPAPIWYFANESDAFDPFTRGYAERAVTLAALSSNAAALSDARAGKRARALSLVRGQLEAARQLLHSPPSPASGRLASLLESTGASALAVLGRMADDSVIFHQTIELRAFRDQFDRARGRFDLQTVLLSADPRDRRALEWAADQSLSPHLRTASAANLLWGFCANPSEILFGLDARRELNLRAAANRTRDLYGFPEDLAVWLLPFRDDASSARRRKSPRESEISEAIRRDALSLRTFYGRIVSCLPSERGVPR